MRTNDILEFIKENDVKFIRLGFCDPMGIQKNISIIADDIEQALKDGIPFDGSVIHGFEDIKNSDLLLIPDANTLSLLPWRPNMNSVLRFYCDIKNSDGTDFINDGRHLLKKTIQDIQDLGFTCKMGTECEFYLFKTSESGEPTMTTLDKGTFLDISPLDKGENIRREICLCLETMGLEPHRSHHDKGPGQNQIDFRVSDVLSRADYFMTFKTVVKSIATRNGLFASFMPKPFLDFSGNRMNVNISLFKNGKNVFNKNNKEYEYAKWFAAGILDKIEEITVFLNPNNNSYERLGQLEAPKYKSWSNIHRSQLLRMPSEQPEGKEMLELTSPDPTVNPYIAFSLILLAGIHGINNKLELSAPINENILQASKNTTSKLSSLPKDLGEAIEKAKNSDFLKKHLGEEFLNTYLAIKSVEYKEFLEASDKEAYYKDTYFEML